MTWIAGQSGNPKGRPHKPNQVTTEIKQAFAKLLEDQGENLVQALEQVRNKDPKSYLELYIKISERFVPAISRAEITGFEGETFQPIQIVIPDKNDPAV